MNVAYYHAYLTRDTGTWLGIVSEQMKLMEDAELFDALAEFYVTGVSYTVEDGKNFTDFVKLYYPRAKVQIMPNPFKDENEMMMDFDGAVANNVIENHTLQKIWEHSKELDANILYFHTKGITAQLRHVNGRHGQMHLYRNYNYWRHFLNWGVLENWRLCTKLLEYYDCAGANYGPNPVPHYSGTFWWATSKHIKELPDPTTLDWYQKMKEESNNSWFKYQASRRFADEMWIGAKEGTRFANVGLFTEEQNPANHYVPRKLYNDKAYA